MRVPQRGESANDATAKGLSPFYLLPTGLDGTENFGHGGSASTFFGLRYHLITFKKIVVSTSGVANDNRMD